MGMFAARLGPLFVWQALALAVAAIGTSVGTYIAFDTINSEGSGSLAEDEQLVPAQIGDLISVVSTDGALSFPTVVTAAFETNGTVGKVFVEEGDTVEEGQTLATLDAASLTTMQLRVARAEVDLRDANDKLIQALEPADAQAIAKAENTIAKAKLALEKAQDDLAVLTDVTQAEADVTDTKAELATAQASLALESDEWDGKVTDAKTAEVDASDAYVAAFDRWLGAPTLSVNPTLDPAAVLATMGADLTALFPVAQSDTNFALLRGTPPDDPATVWNEATLFWYVAFFPGAIIGDCGTTIPLQGTCVSAEFNAAWDTLQTKRTGFATTELNSSKAIDSATTLVTKAADRLASAQQTLAELNSGVDTNKINVARASVIVAQTDVDAAKESLTDLHVAADDKDLEVLRQQVAAAENELNTANDNLTGINLVATITGVVTDVNMVKGDSATGNQSGLITITDHSVVEIAGTVDEIDVLSIAEGVIAAVALTALPDQTLRGTVTAIGSPTNNQGVVTFPVSIIVDVPEGLELREGLSATASVVISQQVNVLRVPTSAIRGSFLDPFVRVSDGGEIVERPVDLGSSDDFWVIVTAGLTQGEQVVMPAPSASSTQFAITPQILRQLQGSGGFGGGQGGRGRFGGQSGQFGQTGQGNQGARDNRFDEDDS
jgi:multidrug efflux pump subunit AcrA (membrane-fusion protein)